MGVGERKVWKSRGYEGRMQEDGEKVWRDLIGEGLGMLKK